MKKTVLIGLILFIGVSSVKAGEYVDAFMELGVSARALAMANTLGALDQTETSFISNPAGLATVRRVRIGMMYTSLFGLANYNYLGLAIPLNKKMTVAVNWIRFGVDDIPIRPDIFAQVANPEARRDTIIALSNLPAQTFKDVEDAVFISISRLSTKQVNLGWFYSDFIIEIPWGVNFKIIRKQLHHLEAYGLGVDIGGRLRVSGEDIFDLRNLGMFSFGLMIRDVTETTIYWSSQRQDVIRLGPVVSFAWEQPLQKWQMHLNFTLEKEYRYHDPLRLGLEIGIMNRIYLRTGLKKSGLAAGAGLNFKVFKQTVNIDYSFMSHDLGATHRIGGSIIF
jgi:hypothetical protein